MSRATKKALARKTYQILLRMLKEVKRRRVGTYIPIDQTRHLPLVVTDLSWEPEDTIDFEPRFCNPFPAKAFNELFEERKQNKRQRYMPTWAFLPQIPSSRRRRLKEAESLSTYIALFIGQADSDGDMAAHAAWLRTYRSKLYHQWQEGEGRQGEIWWMQDIYRALPWPQGPLPTDPHELRKLAEVRRPDLDKPLDVRLRRPGHTPLIHMACSIIESREPLDGSLYRSEMICALSIMTDHMERGRYHREYGIFPVFVYTFSGRSVRVLQVHFDPIKQQLHVRKTSFMHIESEDETDKLKLIMRWIMNKPMGKSKLDDLSWNPEEDEEEDQTDQWPRTPTKSSIRCS